MILQGSFVVRLLQEFANANGRPLVVVRSPPFGIRLATFPADRTGPPYVNDSGQ
jgi:hypothetical protein